MVRLRPLALAVALAVLAPPAVVAAAQETEPEPTTSVVPDPSAPAAPPPFLTGATVPDPSLQPGLTLVRLSSRSYDQAVAAYDASVADLAATQAAQVTADAALATALTERQALRQSLTSARATRRAGAATFTEAERAVRAMAVASFMSQGTDSDPSIYLLAEGLPEPEIRRQLTLETVAVQLGDRAVSIEALAAADALVLEGETALSQRSAALVEATDLIENLRQHVSDLFGQLVEQADAIVDVRRTANVAGVDFTLVVLDAYVSAANLVAAENPGCGLAWWMLAGIGRIESRHGTIRGGTVDATGRPSTSIIGIPLDGNNGTRLITDSDGGALDGDTAFDRAVGPMQFIPTTWASWGRDGNGDGREDPHNLYDAAYAAGVYLCDGQVVSTAAGLSTAYFTYNQSEQYVSDVSGHADRYRRAVEIPEVAPEAA